jgi:flagellar export protein FliJ
MKKFRFPLETLLEYRDHFERNEMAALSRIHAHRRELLLKLQDVRDLRLSYEADRRRKCEIGARNSELILIDGYLEQLRQRSEQLQTALFQCEREVERQTAILLEATKSKNALEKLESQYAAAYRQEERKEDEAFIEEFVGNVHSTNSQGIG